METHIVTWLWLVNELHPGYFYVLFIPAIARIECFLVDFPFPKPEGIQF